jgi:hypothetical protein
MKKIGRNDPCWCGSGLKYKKCHLDRENQTPVELWDADHALRRNFSRKECLALRDMPKPCAGHIVKAQNNFLSPVWWQSLSDTARRAIISRQTKAANPFFPREPNCLANDGLRYVDCPCRLNSNPTIEPIRPRTARRVRRDFLHLRRCTFFAGLSMTLR